MSANSVEEEVVSYSLMCKDCKHKFQLTCEHLLQKADRVCPECGSTRVRQRLVGVIRNLDVAAHDGEKLIPKKC